VTWAEFKEAIEGKGVTGRDVITGFRWFNDQHSKYYVTVWFEGERDERPQIYKCFEVVNHEPFGGQYSE
jgi:hypothetical protein